MSRPVKFLADNHGFGGARERIYENVGVCCDENLATRRRLDQKRCHLWNHVGMETNLRLLNADDRRRIGMAEHGDEAQIAQASVREPRGRNRMVQAFFVEKYLHRATVYCGDDILNRRVEGFQALQYLALYRRLV